jgi:hypothetical protein
VLGDLLGHPLATAGQARVDELPHVAAVLMRARRTARIPPVAAAHHECSVGLVGGRVHRLVTVEHDAAQPDWMPVRPGSADLLQPALALGITRPRDQALDDRGVQLVDRSGGHRRALQRRHKTDTSAREHANTRDNDQSSRNAHGPGENVSLMTPHHQAFQALNSMVTTGSGTGPARVGTVGIWDREHAVSITRQGSSPQWR